MNGPHVDGRQPGIRTARVELSILTDMSKKIARGLYFSTSRFPAPLTALRREAHEYPTLLACADPGDERERQSQLSEHRVDFTLLMAERAARREEIYTAYVIRPWVKMTEYCNNTPKKIRFSTPMLQCCRLTLRRRGEGDARLGRLVEMARTSRSAPHRRNRRRRRHPAGWSP